MSGPASQQTVRRHNRAIVLRQIRDVPGRSRAQLAAATGMSRATVSALVDDLVAGGLVRELDAGRGTRGRPAVPLTLDPDGPAGLGIDINVDYISACIVDLTGQMRERATVVSAQRTAGAARVLRHAVDLARQLVRSTALPLAGAAIALPGLIDREGTIRRLPNLPGLDGVDCGAYLARRLGVPVQVGNEANLAALAEARTGKRDFILVSGEIGVGAGIVVGGALYGGVHGFAGEFGHTVVDPAGPRCGCGSRGCLEQYVGQEALLRAAGHVGDPATWTADPDGVAALLLDAARRGDLRTVESLREAGSILGVALAGALNLLDLQTVVLGGLYARLAPWLSDPITAELDTRLIARAMTGTSVTASVLGSDAAVIGAAGSVVDEIISGGATAFAAADELRRVGL